MFSFRLLTIIAFGIFKVFRPVIAGLETIPDLRPGICNAKLGHSGFNGVYSDDIKVRPKYPNELFVRTYQLYLKDIKMEGKVVEEGVLQDYPDFATVTDRSYTKNKEEFCSNYHSIYLFKLEVLYTKIPDYQAKTVIEFVAIERRKIKRIEATKLENRGKKNLLGNMEPGLCNAHLRDNNFIGVYSVDIKVKPINPKNRFVRTYQFYLREIYLTGRIDTKGFETDVITPDFDTITDSSYTLNKTLFCAEYLDLYKEKINDREGLVVSRDTEIVAQDVTKLAYIERKRLRAFMDAEIKRRAEGDLTPYLTKRECIHILKFDLGFTGDFSQDFALVSSNPDHIYVRSYKRYLNDLKKKFGPDYGTKKKKNTSYYQHRDAFCCSELEKFSKEIFDEDKAQKNK